jgi:glycosyltransferase involved in cell wall biosynthesis
MKRRLLFLRRTSAYGGARVVLLYTLQGIEYEANSVQLATLTDVFSSAFSTLKLPVEVVPISARFGGNPVRGFISWLWFLCRLRPYKIIFAEGSFSDFPLPVALAGYLVARGRIYVMALHPAPDPPPKASRRHWGLMPGMGLAWYRHVVPWRVKGKLVRRTLAISRGIKQKLVRHYGFPSERVEVIYCGVDTSSFSVPSADERDAGRRMWAIPKDALVVVSTARLDPDKKLERLIRAFGALATARDDLHMLLTGKGGSREELEALSRSVDSGGRIRFVGHVPDVRLALHASDIYALPSDEEGFGIALVEAMACGLICVATRTTGPSEIIQHERNGFLVGRSFEGLLDGLQMALALNHHERDSMARAARRTVLEKFRLEDAVARGLACLEIEQAGMGIASARSFADRPGAPSPLGVANHR